MENQNDLRLINTYRAAIMGFAALWIYIFHEWVPVIDRAGILQDLEKYVKYSGFCGVDIFFFLSGMGLIHSMEKHSVLTFYQRRMSRVLIPYTLTAVAMMIGQGWSLELFFKNLVGYNFWTKDIYSFLWFVPAILTLYLLFPLYYRAFQKAPSKFQLTAAVLILWLFLTLQLEGKLRYDLFGFTNRLPVFFAGVLVGWVVWEREVVFTGLTWAVTGLTLFLGIFLAYKTNFEGYYFLVPASNCCAPNFLMAVSGSCLLAKGFSLLERFTGKFGKTVLKVLGFFGKMSFELYCVQEWIGGEITASMQGRFDSKIINPAVFAGVFSAMVLLYGSSKLVRTAGGTIRKLVKIS